MQAVIPRPDIAPLLQEGFVALAGDVDEPGPEIQRLMFRLEGAMMLPFVIVADAEGGYLDGFSGAVAPERLKSLLEGVQS